VFPAPAGLELVPAESPSYDESSQSFFPFPWVVSLTPAGFCNPAESLLGAIAVASVFFPPWCRFRRGPTCRLSKNLFFSRFPGRPLRFLQLFPFSQTAGCPTSLFLRREGSSPDEIGFFRSLFFFSIYRPLWFPFAVHPEVFSL